MANFPISYHKIQRTILNLRNSYPETKTSIPYKDDAVRYGERHFMYQVRRHSFFGCALPMFRTSDIFFEKEVFGCVGVRGFDSLLIIRF